jgi:hypothetical protein
MGNKINLLHICIISNFIQKLLSKRIGSMQGACREQGGCREHAGSREHA